ncbi:MAG: extracellular matrix regulator RemB [Acutalibacteraceae bacterium]|jgi:hypothetical protein
MFLHLGGDTVVPLREVVGIFDMDFTTVSRATRAFLADAEKGGRVVNVTDELPRSFVVCADRQGNETVYICQLAPATLRKRAKSGGG